MPGPHLVRGIAAAGLFLICLHGCVAPPKTDTPAPPPPPVPTAQEQSEAPQPSAAPVVALIKKAQGERREGRLEQAAASVERALRIDPYDSKLWNLLAAIRLQQGNAAQAEAMASKSNSLARNDRRLQRENWLIIAQARRQRGDEDGAREAEQRARTDDGAT